MKKITTLFVALLTAQFAFAQNLVDLNVIGTYETGVFDDGAMEIVTYNAADQKLYAVNASDKTIDIFDISNPTAIAKIDSIDLSAYGDQANSVDFHNGILVAAVENDDFDKNGKAVFFDASGTFLKSVEVGVLPDMIIFTPDGTKVLTANEGEPDDDYTFDPMGSVSIIDISGGVNNLTQANVTTLDFTSFNNNYDPMIRNFGPVINYLEDFQTTNDSLDNVIIANTATAGEGWYYDNFNSDYFAEANSFSASGPVKSWMITPAVNLTGLDSAYFSFENTKNFSGGSFNVLVSTDYDPATHTDPANASWDTITNLAHLSTGGYLDTNSGKISLHNYLTDNVSFGFLYEGTPGGGNGTLWQIDDLKIEGTRPELARNLEPEYIAIAPNSSTAYVVCQENNAIATIDLTTNTFTDIKALGFKDYSSGNYKMDASNTAGSVNIRNWPVYGMYQPDAMVAFEDNGQVYIATANEGDARDYDAYSEEDRVKDLTLDATAFPNAANLQMNDSLGRLNITTSLGDTDGDGDYDELYSYGGRSFSIWNDQISLVFDSEDEFAQTILQQYPNEFNSNNDDNSSFKSRSDDKGSEPEAIEVAMINGKRFAFIGLERMGGVMVYDITDPTAPAFVSYYLNRDFSIDADKAGAGDLGPECLKFIPAAQSPNGKNLLVASNEVSGTLSIYEISGTIGLDEEELANVLQVYPNPTNSTVKFTREVKEGKLIDLSGRQLMIVNGDELNMTSLPSGIYILVEGEISLQIMKK